MANAFADIENQTRAAQSSPDASERALEAASTAANFSAKGKDVYYQPGTEHVTQHLGKTSLYEQIKESDRAKTIRDSDTVHKINQGSNGVDNFFTRIKNKIVSRFTPIKDAVVNKFQSAYQRIKKILHIGNDAAPATNTVSEATSALAGDAAVTAERTAATGVTESISTTAVTKGSTIFGKAWGIFGKVAGYVAIPLTLLVGAFQTKRDIKNHDGHKAMKTAGNTVGGLVGGITAGAIEGLVIGGILGIEIPVLGSIVFGIVGAFVGGWLGAKAMDGAFGNKLHAKLNTENPANLPQHSQPSVNVARSSTYDFSQGQPDQDDGQTTAWRDRIIAEKERNRQAAMATAGAAH